MKNTFNNVIITVIVLIITVSCHTKKNKKVEKTTEEKTIEEKGTFGYDKAFLLKHYKNTIVLESNDGKSGMVLSPELQGRVMTSTLNGEEGMSFGWLNYDLISSKETKNHFNPTGGEERFWLGPEGGQFSIYFAKDKSFEFENWYVPASIDTEAFTVIEQNDHSVLFKKEMNLVNYSGTKFNIDVNRKVSLLTKQQVLETLELSNDKFNMVAYETQNKVKNIGKEPWSKDSGLLSIWLLSMMTPSPEVTVVVPIKEGLESEKGIKVNDNYFGKVADDRLKSTQRNVFFKADGKSRGKIGFSPQRSTEFIGSYDAQNKVLTILQIPEPKPTDKYVNSAWELQKDPYSGDVLNSYNDGPLEDGSQMGPFYELESSSPALALKPNQSYIHTQRIYHFKGSKVVLNKIAKQLLKVSIEEIEAVF
ncbi:hypothetical protein BXY82_1829 [Gelidibacter sediminis]|uniref:Lipoprotein n=1 Tax=Gelidibacter sediminis TaxID=1608710 RepID=A0A4R7PXY0_9FLAO|nr:DUF6786 family protein [Gelidibacter sediminis]TDU39798.1 hypothetical protein BXY82_1829 [Gelidibacter sediminis]